MKRLTLIFGLLILFVAGNAQTAQTPTNAEKAHTQVTRMKKILTLSDDQVVKCEAVLLSKIIAIEAITNDGSKSGPVQTAEIQKVQDEKDRELAAILTPDQYATYLHKRAEARERQENSGN